MQMRDNKISLFSTALNQRINQCVFTRKEPEVWYNIKILLKLEVN